MAFVFTDTDLFSQNSSVWKQFGNLSCAEKRWVICHPFIAKKAFIVSVEAGNVSDNMANDRQFDGDKNGGQIDAFRHTYWMARLSQEINPRKALKLGKAHEKGNYRDFLKNRNEEGTLPDSIACLMDLLNNENGIRLGTENKTADQEKMIFLVKKEILAGNLWIIKKDIKGNYLSCAGELILREELAGSWSNRKCLVKSDQTAMKKAVK